MPAKTVVFLGLRKNDGENYRVLTSGLLISKMFD